jgi:hypothetical protein
VKRAVLVVLALAGGAALLYAATLAQAGFECEACMRFDARTHCAAAAAGTREAAEQAAVMAACGALTGGVTASLQCQATAPVSLRCQEP